MRTSSRILLSVASAALLLLLVLPLWTIRLQAPQYPEGLGLVISVRSIEGVGPHDLQNINGLNHYIGMKPIHPDDIPELRWMPWIVVALALTGLAAAFSGRRVALFAWTGALLGVAAVGIVDFWRWEYDYGHNLDQATAIIKVPGMSYQPPLIGSKRLLNFVATSWPGAGGWIALAATGIAVVLVLRELQFRRAARSAPVQRSRVRDLAGAAR